MGFFELFRDYFRSQKHSSTANKAKERLQIIIAHDRLEGHDSPDYLPALKQELMEVIRKYVAIDPDQVKVSLDKEDDYEVLELNIILPDQKE